MKPLSAILSIAALCLAANAHAQSGPTRVVDPRCEYRANPLGIDSLAPRLSWRLDSDIPGEHQTAYQILVADSPEALAADSGALWDTGKIESNATAQIEYTGNALTAKQPYFWKVRVWDNKGNPTPWSDPAQWSMGLLAPSDWQASWIGYDAPVKTLQEQAAPAAQDLLKGARWIWAGDADAETSAALGKAAFRKTFRLPAGEIDSAEIRVTVDNECAIYVNGELATPDKKSFSGWQTLHQAAVKKLKTDSDNIIAIEASNAGVAPNPAGVLVAMTIKLKDGSESVIATDFSWKGKSGQIPANWNAADFDDSNWGFVNVLGETGMSPWGAPAVTPEINLPPAPYFRKEFAAKPAIKRATIYASALGLYELQLNGQRVGDLFFTPGWTDYHKRVYYNTYDVTPLIKQGETNALGAILADGWYAGYVGFRLFTNQPRPRNFYGGEPRLRAQLEIEYTDGTKEIVNTDPSWKAAYGPTLESDLLMGETQDLRINYDGWSTPGFDDSTWHSGDAIVTGAVEVPVQAYPGAPVKQFERIPAIDVKEVAPKTFVYNLGQNIAGWAQIRVQGASGQHVVVRYAERLDDAGNLYTINLRKARATDTYILRGGDVEVLEPKFTFHGFQYVEISGVDTPPAPTDVVGVMMNADVQQTGHFECSEPLLNQLFHNIIWGQKGNYLEIPTDCPQRDERLGWTGDAQFFMPTAAYCADVSAFFNKWLTDLVVDSQLPDGSWADVAPNLELGGGNVAWGDAAIICTYQMYRYYGDKRIVERLFPNLEKGMAFLETTSKDYVRSKIGYGDWLNLGGGAKDEVICTAYYAYLSGLMAEMAKVIGNEDRATYYAGQHEKIREAFITQFVAEDGKILDSSQTGYALAFTMDLLPEDRRAKAADQFVAEIAKFNDHLATGFIGTPRLLPGLSKAGRRDVAYKLLMNTSYPSWLFQVTLGATTMWERWDGWTPDKGFQDPGMNSFNHYAFGAVGEYLFSEVGGIRSTAPAFNTIVIAPEPGGGLTYATTKYQSIHGTIVSDWKVDGAKFTLTVTVPPNVTAEVHVPAKSAEFARGGNSNFTKFLRYENGKAIYTAQPGTWYFSSER